MQSFPVLARHTVMVAGYFLLWFLLWKAAALYELTPNISVWYPPAGLTLALLLLFGLRYLPVVFALELLIGFGIWLPHDPLGWMLFPVIITGGYGLVAGLLLYVLHFDSRLLRLRDVVWFILIGVGGALLVATAGMVLFVTTGMTPAPEYWRGLLHWWIGDALGITILTPVLLLYGQPLRRWVFAQASSLESQAQAVSRTRLPRLSLRLVVKLVLHGLMIFLALWMAFFLFTPVAGDSHTWHLLYFPIIWIAFRYGLRGSTVAVLAINVATIGIFKFFQIPSLLIELQIFMLSMSLLSLILAAVIGEQKADQKVLQRVQEKLKSRTAKLSVINRQLSEEITTRRQAEEALLQAQKMEAVGQLTGGVAHDFNNLLTIITGNLQMLEEQLREDPLLGRLVQGALKAAAQGAELIGKLLVFSRRQALRPQPIDLNQLLGNMTELLHRTLGETIAIETRLERELWPALVDAHQVEMALLNLAVNARDAMPHGGTLTIATTNITLGEDYAAREAEVSPGDYVLLAVSDTGTGIPPAMTKQVFEPFFTTKATGKGSGLGLSMVYGFAKQSGGHIKIDSEPGQGTTVKLYLPRATDFAERPAEPGPFPLVPAAGGETVLVVEDELGVRELAVLFLTDLGYRVLEAADGQSALASLERQPTIDLLFVDLVLPGGLNGLELARQARHYRPDLKVLFTSGYAKDAILGQEKLSARVRLLVKPYQKADLARAVRGALEDRPERRDRQ